jgi:hypothetical protein
MLFERRLEFIGRQRRMLAVIVLFHLALFGGFGLVFVRSSSWISGTYWGGVAVGLAWFLSWFLEMDGSHFARRGAWAEEWTSDALRKRFKGWTVVDDVPLEYGNLDHVLVGPGGIYAVETKWRSKWRNRALRISSPEFHRYRVQAEDQASALRALLVSLGAMHRVDPALVLWGPGVEAREVFIKIGAVQVLFGDEVKSWPDRAFQWRTLSGTEIESVTRVIEGHVSRHDSAPRLSVLRKALRITHVLLRRPVTE